MTIRQLLTYLRRAENAVPALVAALCLLTAVFGDAARAALRYERTALAAGELWRVFTAHLVHLSVTHTLLNLAGLALIATIFHRELRLTEWLGGGCVAAVGIAAGLYLIDTDTSWYVGLSGVLHGWFVLGAARVSEHQRGFGVTMLLGLAAKLIYEQTLGTMPFTLSLDIGPVVVAAHLYGAVAAALFYVTLRWLAGSARGDRYNPRREDA